MTTDTITSFFPTRTGSVPHLHLNPVLGYRLFIYIAAAGQLNVLTCGFSFVNKGDFHDVDGLEKSSPLCIL